MSETQTLLSPRELIERFCGEAMAAANGRFGTRAGQGKTTSKGFCGFTGSDGYDDGYAFMDDLLPRGWVDLPGKGDWPYLVYLVWRPKDSDDRPAIAEYREGGLTVWVFDSAELAKRHYDGLKDIP